MKKIIVKALTALVIGAAISGGIPNCNINALKPSTVEAATGVHVSVQQIYYSKDQMPLVIGYGETINGVYCSGTLKLTLYGYDETMKCWRAFYAGYLYPAN